MSKSRTQEEKEEEEEEEEKEEDAERFMRHMQARHSLGCISADLRSVRKSRNGGGEIQKSTNTKQMDMYPVVLPIKEAPHSDTYMHEDDDDDNDGGYHHD